MVEIVKQLGWTYVSTVAAQVWFRLSLLHMNINLQGEYGEKGISSFIQLATKSGICIGVSITINRNADNEEFDEVVETLQSNEKAKVGLIRQRPLVSPVLSSGGHSFCG